MKGKKKDSRQFIYKITFFFTLIYFTLLYFQKRILLGLFQTQLSFSIPDTIAILTSEDKLEGFINRSTNGAILTGSFLAFEIFIFISLIIYLFVKLFLLYRRKKWQNQDFLLLAGLLILLLGSFYYTYIFVSSTHSTYIEIEHIVKHFTPKQIANITKQWSTFFYQYDFSALNFMKDYIVVADQFSITVDNVKEIGKIPDILNLWLNHLNLLKLHYFLVMCSGFLMTLIAQLFNYRSNGSIFNKNKKIDIILAENRALQTQLITVQKKDTKRKSKKNKKKSKKEKITTQKKGKKRKKNKKE